MHILVIPSWYPTYAGDVGGSFFREQSLALAKRGYQVGVIYPQIRSLKDVRGVINKPYGLIIEDDNSLATYRWHGVNFFPRMACISQKLWISKGLKAFGTYVRDHGMPDIIHAHSLLNGGVLANAISHKYDIPYVVTEHSTAFARGLIKKTDIKRLLPVVKEASLCLGVSQEFSSYLNTIFSLNKWKYLPNIVSNSFLKTPLLSSNLEHFAFLNICLLDKKKRVDLLIKAFARLTGKYGDVILRIGGDGPEREKLEALVKELQIEDRVCFLGMLSRENVLKEMQKANSFVLSSDFETFGVVLVEALALGKPVISTRSGGPESIVTPEVGYLVERDDVKDLAEAMEKMYLARDAWDSKKIRAYCEQNFSEEAVVQRLSALYNQVIDNDTQ